MKDPSPACFATWQEHKVVTHTEWLKWSGDMRVVVQRFAANWGYLIMRSDKSQWIVVSGKFRWDWTAIDACAIAEEAWARATGVTP